jgi:tRNA threonylcarbamoyladenosine biosynthesis protein TsaB
MKILVVDSALACCTAAVIGGAAVLAQCQSVIARDRASPLSDLAGAALAQAGLEVEELDLIAATVGPGSFTGIRAGLALAHGLALAVGIPVIGVTVGEAMADALPRLGHRVLWVAIASRRGRVFLERGGGLVSAALDALPTADGAVAVAGDAAPEVAARLAARGGDVMLTDVRRPAARHVGLVAARRHAGALPALAAQPLYVDPPEAALPAGGLRPLPA